MKYEAPIIIDVGSIADLTQGGDPANLGDGAAFRGPATQQPPITS